MPRSQSNRLRNARDNGAVIKSDDGAEVKYDSRGAKDDKPWKKPDGTRLAGTDCKATIPEGN